jgi:hypothetical protein
MRQRDEIVRPHQNWRSKLGRRGERAGDDRLVIAGDKAGAGKRLEMIFEEAQRRSLRPYRLGERRPASSPQFGTGAERRT